MDELRKEPTEKQLMEDALRIAQNETADLEQRLAALTALRYLVEPIDSANSRSLRDHDRQLTMKSILC